MAHIAGLVAAGAHESPLTHAHIVTSTTHKTLRCARGGLILSNDEAIGKKINSAMFPGLQGGPLMHAIAGKAAGLGEALRPEFKTYIAQVVENAKTLADTLLECGFDIVSGGTDNHIVLVDLRPKKLTGDISEVSLERADIACNKNGVPFDPEKPMVTSGIRLGTPAATTRGFGADEFRQVGLFIGEVLDGLASNPDDNSQLKALSAKKCMIYVVPFQFTRFGLYFGLYWVQSSITCRSLSWIVPFAIIKILKSKIRARVKMGQRSDVAVNARHAPHVSPLLNGCSCAN